MNKQRLRLFLTTVLSFLFGMGIVRAQDTNQVNVIDLLVVYTPAAMSAAGGPEAIQSQIQQALLETHTVFQGSKVDARIRLVGSSEVAYEETGSLYSDLENLRNGTDGLMDEVHALRNQAGADLVCLVAESGYDYSYYGFQGPSSANAFSVIKRTALIGSYSLPVVLAFNFGCQTERGYADSEAAFSYAYGYSFYGQDDVYYSTVEAFSGERLPFFSNPRILFKGVPMGVPVGQTDPADNVSVLNKTAPIVAGFRGGALRTFPPAVRLVSPTNGTVQVTGLPFSLLADASDRDGHIVKVDFYADAQPLGTATESPFSLSVSNLQAGRHSFVAIATDNHGVQSISEHVLVLATPSNDLFSNREVITGRHVIRTNSNEFASIEPNEPPHSAWTGHGSVWWSWTAPESGVLTIDAQDDPAQFACQARFMAVYTGLSLTNLARITNSYEVSGSPRVQFRVDAGATYNIVVDSVETPPWMNCSAGSFILNLRLSTAKLATPQPGDTFTEPVNIPITLDAETNSIVQAGFYANGTHLRTITAPPFSLVWSNVPPGIHSLQAFLVDDQGDTWPTIPVSIAVRPRNDHFTNRILLTRTPTNFYASLAGATLEPGEEAFGSGHTLWWSWTAPSDGNLKLLLSSGSFAPAVRLFTGESLATLSKVGEVLNASLTNPVFQVTAGRTYQIALDKNSAGSPGYINFNMDFVPLLLNDNITNRIRLTNANITVIGSSRGATSDPLVPEDAEKVWYSWVAPTNGSAWLTVSNSSGSLGQNIYTRQNPTGLLAKAGTSTPRGGTLLEVEAGVEYFIAIGAAADSQLRLVFGPHGSNDNFTNRTLIAGLLFTDLVSNTRATLEPGELDHSAYSIGKSLWWTWTAPARGRVTLSATNSTFPVTLTVYTGSLLPNLTQQLGVWSVPQLGFEVESNLTYQIAVDTRWGSPTGLVELTLKLEPTPAPPINDYFASRLPLLGHDFTLVASNASATLEPGEPNRFGCMAGSVWWTWTPPASGRVLIKKLSSTVPGHLQFYTGSALPGLVSHASLSRFEQEARFDVVAGTPYQIVFDSCNASNALAAYQIVLSTVQLAAPANGSKFFAPAQLALQPAIGPLDGSTTNVDFFANGIRIGAASLAPFVFQWMNVTGGVYSLEVKVTDTDGKQRWSRPVSIRVVPPNDDFANRLPILGDRATVHANTYGATTESGEPIDNLNSGRTTVWYTWTPLRSSRVLLTSLESTFWAVPRLYTGASVFNLSLVPNLSGESPASARTLIADVTAGTPYHVAVDSFRATGYPTNGSLVLNLFSTPTNDNFATPTPLLGSNTTWLGWTHLGSMEPTEPLPPGWNQSGRTVWSTWTAPTGGVVTLSLQKSYTPSGAYLGVYSGTANFVRVADNHTNGLFASQVSFRSMGGERYYFTVGDNDTDPLFPGVEFTLQVAFAPAPPNDQFIHRIQLSGPYATDSRDLATASSEPGEPNHGGVAPTRSVWWTWTAPTNGRVALVLRQGTNSFAGRVGIYTGTALSNLSVVATNNFTLLPPAARALYDPETASFNAAGGTVYQIAVDTSAAAPGNGPVTLHLILARASMVTPESVLLSPTNLLLSASITDFAPTVTQVVFHAAKELSTQNWTSAASPPFSVLWSNPPAGNYTLVAQALDEQGRSSFSSPARFSVKLPNDLFAEALPLDGISTSLHGFNAGGSSEPGEILLPKASGATLWWRWTAPINGSVTVGRAQNTNQAPYDPAHGPLIAVFTGQTLSNLTMVASNTYHLPGPIFPPPWSFASIAASEFVSFSVTAGTTYHISVDRMAGEQGHIELTLQMALANLVEPQPESVHGGGTNLLLRAQLMDAGVVVQRLDFLSGTNVIGSIAHQPFEFLWQPVPPGTHRLSVRAVTESGTTISEPFNIYVGNDRFSHRLPLVGNDLLITCGNSLASSELGENQILGWPTRPSPCYSCTSSGVGAGKTLWWTWTAPADGLLEIDLSGNTTRPVISILQGDTLTNLTRLAHNAYYSCDNCSGCADQARAQATLTVIGGQEYQIALDSLKATGTGPFQFKLRFFPPPANDAFAQRQFLSGTALIVPASNWGATHEEGEPLQNSHSIHSVWYSWTAPQSGAVTISRGPVQASQPKSVIIIQNPCYKWETPSPPPAFEPTFSVFQGNNLSQLSPVASGSYATFHAQAGTTYSIAMDGRDGTTGQAHIQLTLVTRPGNDNFNDRTVLTGFSPTLDGHNIGATIEPHETILDPVSQGRSAWWTWTAPASGTVHLGENWALTFGVFVGSSMTNLLLIANGTGTLDFAAVAGTTYQIAVADLDDYQDTFTLEISGLRPPPHIAPGYATRLPDGSFELIIEGTPGQSFGVQASTDLFNWQTIHIDTLALAPWTTFVDPDASQSPHRFYRVVALEDLLFPSQMP